MPYDFPKKKIRTGDVVTPEILNGMTQQAAELFSGRLDRHNLTDDLDLDHNSANSTQGNTGINHYRFSRAVNPETDNAGTWQPPTNPPTGQVFTLPDNLTWVTVADLSRTITTGTSTLWIYGFLQYIWHNYATGSGTGQLVTVNTHGRSYGVAANIQVVVTLNGTLLIDTLAGHDNPAAKAVRPYRWRQTQDFDDDEARGLPGMLTGYSLDIAGMGPEALPVRFMSFPKVQAGTHTIEVKIRRLFPSYGARNLRDDIFVYNRWLYVGEIQDYPPAAAVNATVATKHYEPGDTVNAAGLNAGGLGGVAAAYNDIQRGSLARGALTRQHLKSISLGAGTEVWTADQTADNWYPGWNVSNVTPTALGSNVGWYEIESANVAIAITEPCYLIILADFHLRGIFDNSASGLWDNCALFHAILGIRATEDGGSPAVEMFNGSMATVGQYNVWGKEPPNSLVNVAVVPDHARVAMGWVVDYTTVPDPELTINQVKLYASGQTMYVGATPTEDPTYTVTAGRLSWILVKA